MFRTTNVVRSVVPETSSILAGDTNAFELLLRVNTTTTTLWLRRTAGAVATTYRVRIELIGDGSQTLTEAATAVVDAAVYTTIDFSPAAIQGTEFYVGGQTVNDALSDKTGNIFRQGKVVLGTAWNTNTIVPYNPTDVVLQLSTDTPIGPIVSPVGTAADGKALRLWRGGTSGTKWPMSADITVGSYFADINARTRLDINLGNAGSATPDTNVGAILASGAWGMGANVPFARLDHRLNIEGPNASIMNALALRTNGDAEPVQQHSGWSHDNNWISFDGWYSGSAWRASHTSRPYGINKQSGQLRFYGQAALPAAAGSVWTLDHIASFQYAGATLARGELFFENVVKNRRIVFFDGNSGSDHQFYGFGINGSTLRYQVSATSAAHRFYAAVDPLTSNQVFAVLGIGNANVDPGDLNSGLAPTLGNALTFGANQQTGITSRRSAGAGQNGLSFWTTNVQRMTLLSTGQLGIGTTAPILPLSVNGDANKTGGPTWSVFSDERAKQAISDYKTGLDGILKLQPRKFKYIKGMGWGTDWQVGFVAQEVEKNFPGMVTTVARVAMEGEKADDKGAYPTMTDFKMVNTSEMLFMMVNATKELDSRLAALESAKKT